MLAGGAAAVGPGEWTGTGYTTTSTKTSQRTYIDSDGTEVTEVQFSYLFSLLSLLVL